MPSRRGPPRRRTTTTSRLMCPVTTTTAATMRRVHGTKDLLQTAACIKACTPRGGASPSPRHRHRHRSTTNRNSSTSSSSSSSSSYVGRTSTSTTSTCSTSTSKKSLRACRFLLGITRPRRSPSICRHRTVANAYTKSIMLSPTECPLRRIPPPHFGSIATIGRRRLFRPRAPLRRTGPRRRHHHHPLSMNPRSSCDSTSTSRPGKRSNGLSSRPRRRVQRRLRHLQCRMQLRNACRRHPLRHQRKRSSLSAS